MHVSPMPSTTSGPFPATVRGLGIGRGVFPLQPGHTQSVPGSVPGVSQTSPIPSPSLSFWSGVVLEWTVLPGVGEAVAVVVRRLAAQWIAELFWSGITGIGNAVAQQLTEPEVAVTRRRLVGPSWDTGIPHSVRVKGTRVKGVLGAIAVSISLAESIADSS